MSFTPEQVREAVTAGRITQAEADYYLAQENSGEKRNRIAATAMIMLFLIGGLLLFAPDVMQPVGRVVLDITGAQNGNTTPVENTTRITVTGTLIGEGNAAIYFDTASGTLLIANITSDDGSPRTDRPSYIEGEEITVEHAPLDATYYFDDGTTTNAITMPYIATAASGTLLIVANTTEGIVTYRLPILIGNAPRITHFEGLCTETCAMAEQSGSIRVVTSDGAYLNFTQADANTTQQNHPPTLAMPLPALDINETVTIDLTPYFSDIDGDTLFYSPGTSDVAELIVNGNMLSIIPLQSGTQNVNIYASDLKELLPASMTITVTMPVVSPPAQNETTLNETPPTTPTNETNVTINTTVNTTTNETNATTTPNTTIDCSNPDPNARPLECLQNTTTDYFPEQDIYWYDDNHDAVGRFTPIGNLLITGDIIAPSGGSPTSGTFRIGYEDENGAVIPTIWVDEEGNLHARGNVYEENSNLAPPPGSYSFNNRKGITLAYADARNGDLYIRGNIIPFRKNVR